MVNVYDMATGVICRDLLCASKTGDADKVVSVDQPQETGSVACPHNEEEQLALREQEHSKDSKENAGKIPPELTSVNTDEFINDMEK